MLHVSEWEKDKTAKRLCMILSLLIVVGLFMVGRTIMVSTTHEVQNLVATFHFLKQSENYQQREEILKALSQNDVELEDAIEIAQTVIHESKKNDIPISLMLAIMKKESNFNVDARSSVNAMGIMQIHPLTWDAYAKKLNLNVSRKQAFDPALNIKVAAAVIWDLRDQYAKKGHKDKVLWDYVLSAYYAGGESLKGGMRKNHRHYVKKVRQYADELSKGSRTI